MLIIWSSEHNECECVRACVYERANEFELHVSKLLCFVRAHIGASVRMR